MVAEIYHNVPKLRNRMKAFETFFIILIRDSKTLIHTPVTHRGDRYMGSVTLLL